MCIFFLTPPLLLGLFITSKSKTALSNLEDLASLSVIPMHKKLTLDKPVLQQRCLTAICKAWITAK